MQKDIINKKTSGWLKIDSNLKEKIFDFCKGYIKFLNVAKTEREASKEIISNLKDCGFKNINDVQSLKEKDKVYMINRDKSIYAAVIGSKNITEGVNLVGAHIDSPRLDLKPNPLYEDY